MIVLESEIRKQRDTASKESKTKEKESERLRKKGCLHRGSLMETRTTLRSLSETPLTTVLPSSALFDLVPRFIVHKFQCTLLINKKVSVLLVRHSLRMRIPNIKYGWVLGSVGIVCV